MSEIDELAAEFGLSGKKPTQTKTKANPEYDALAREYGLVPTKDIKPEKEKSWWQGFVNDPSWSGLAARVGIGAVRGAKDVVDTAAHGLGAGVSYVADKYLPESVAAPIRESVGTMKAEDTTARDQYDKEYGESISAGTGRVAGEIAATIPAMLAAGSVMRGMVATAGALPRVTQAGMRAAPLSNRLIAATGVGGIGGAIFGATTSSTNDKSLGENVGEGAVTGALAGPLLTAAGQGAKSLIGKAIGDISPVTARLAQEAERLGIRLKGTQVSDSHFMKKTDQMTGYLPFSGAKGTTAAQNEQIARAVSRQMGENTDTINAHLIRNARGREGNRIEQVGANTTITADQRLGQDFTALYNNISGSTNSNVMPAVRRQLQGIMDVINANNGTIPGKAYVNLTKKDSMLWTAQKSKDPDIRNAANMIRHALDDALARHATPQMREQLLDARAKYKAIMTVREAMKGQADGNFSIVKLMRAVEKAPGGLQGAGDLGRIAEIGQHFFKAPADSGTPLGNLILNNVVPWVQNPLAGAAAVGAAASQGATYLGGALTAASLTANRLMRKAMNSDAAREAYLNRASGATHGRTNRLIETAVPYVTAPVDNNNRLQITVNPKSYDVNKLPVSKPPQN